MRTSGEIRHVLLAQRHLSRGAPFRPRKLELKFGFEDGSGLPALEIHTAGGRRVQLRGVIDRVDLAELADELLGIVIDYKRTRDKRLSLTHVYHGLSLQLVAYLLALTERGTSLAGRPIRPVGAFYISLHPQYQIVEHPDEFDPQRAASASPHRPRGVLDAAAISALDGAYADGQSTAYQFARKQDGSISRIDTSDGAEREAFESLLTGTRAKLGELADRVLEGDISVAPYRLRNTSPCTWCAFGPVCRFEYGQEGMRFLDDLKRSEVFAKLTVRGKSS
jgi:ATP-dependent helicase/nuclease subunit B